MTDEDDLFDSITFSNGSNITTGASGGRGKSHHVITNLSWTADTDATTFGRNVFGSRHNRRERFVGNLMTLPDTETIDTAQFTDPMDAVVELIHETRRNHGRPENYTLFAGNRAHYWITGPEMGEREWIQTALGEESPKSIRGVSVENADDLLPSTVMVMLDEDQIRFNGVIDHPIAIGLNAGADMTISLGLDGEGTADITWVGPNDLPRGEDHAWIPDEPDFPRVPRSSGLYDEDEEPSPETQSLRYMTDARTNSKSMEADEMVEKMDQIHDEAEEMFTERYVRRTTGELMDELVENTARNAMVRCTQDDDSE